MLVPSAAHPTQHFWRCKPPSHEGRPNRIPIRRNWPSGGAADGTFHDPAGVGYVLAQQIYSDSLKLTVSPVPTNTLEFAVSQGSVKVTFENFKPISDTLHSELLPYTGTADLVVLNTSSESVTFIPVDGMLFTPANGTSEQTLISHLDVPIAPTTLPTTGGTTLQNAWVPTLLLLVLGASLLSFGLWIRRVGKSIGRERKR